MEETLIEKLQKAEKAIRMQEMIKNNTKEPFLLEAIEATLEILNDAKLGYSSQLDQIHKEQMSDSYSQNAAMFK